MKKDYTHIAVVLDRSGSMSSMTKDVNGGFDTFIEDQKKAQGEATLSLVKFDNIYEVVHDFINIKDAKGLDLSPRGSTALLDAMGQTLDDVRTKVLAMPEAEQPEKVIFVFITDGGENASSKYTRKQIFEMIKDLKTPSADKTINWDFVFIGANQDAISEGAGYGISARKSMTWDASGAGATEAFNSLSRGVTSYRMCCMSQDSKGYEFDDADYKAQEDLLKSKKSSSTPRSSTIKGSIPSYISDLDDGLVDVTDSKTV